MIINVAIGVTLGILAAAGLIYAGYLWGSQVLRIAIRCGWRVWLHKVRIITISSVAAGLIVVAIIDANERSRQKWAAENQRQYEFYERERVAARAKYCARILASPIRPITVDKTNLLYSVLVETERQMEQERKDCRSEKQ
jgi:hypothetical protein